MIKSKKSNIDTCVEMNLIFFLYYTKMYFSDLTLT